MIHRDLIQLDCFCLPAPGTIIKDATALIADRLSSSCFSYSCLTAFALTYKCNENRKKVVDFGARR